MPFMNAKDTISATMAECFITIKSNRYQFLQLLDFESNLKINIAEVPILGKIMKGHKVTGATGEWSAKAQFNQSIFREVMLEYKNTGVFPYFDIQVTNEDPTSAVGKQTIILKECLFEGGVLSKFEAGGEFLDEELKGTFDDFEMPDKFSMLAGMQ